VPALQLCTEWSSQVKATNGSAAWALIFTAHADPTAENLAGLVPGQAAVMPSVNAILASIAHDAFFYQAYLACRALGVVVRRLVDWCDGDQPPESETVKMISMVRDGEGVVAAANGYYAVATGTRAGNTQSFPSGGAAAPGVETAATGSFLLTTVSSLVMPLIALALNWGWTSSWPMGTPARRLSR
jgi:hypothetical protein